MKKKQKVLIVYTGGTFGMERVSKKRSFQIPKLSAEKLRSRLRRYLPEMEELATCDVKIMANTDSCHLDGQDWSLFSKEIQKLSRSYQGVILLHGTDTLSYTACALSLTLSKLSCPLILTGAQRPVSEIRNDARQNLLSALEIVTQVKKNLVYVFFGNSLFLATKVRKKSSTDFDAFDSPRFPALAHIGSDLYFTDTFSKLKKPKIPMSHTSFSHQILSIQIHPGFHFPVLHQDQLKSIRGVLMTVYASGTAPTHHKPFIEFLSQLKKENIPCIWVTERFGKSSPDGLYDSNDELKKLGCISGEDNTPESAYVKMSYILGFKKPSKKFITYWNQIKKI